MEQNESLSCCGTTLIPELPEQDEDDAHVVLAARTDRMIDHFFGEYGRRAPAVQPRLPRHGDPRAAQPPLNKAARRGGRDGVPEPVGGQYQELVPRFPFHRFDFWFRGYIVRLVQPAPWKKLQFFFDVEEVTIK